MRQVKSPSFEFFEPDQIAQTNVVEHLISTHIRTNTRKSGAQTWACAWAPDNSYFAWSSGYGILQLIPWNSATQKRHNPSDTEGLKDRKYHIIDCGDYIWAVAFGSGPSLGKETASSVRRSRFDQALILATGLENGKIKLWNCDTGTLIIELLDHRDTVRGIDFTKDGSLQLVSASRDGSVKLWDLNTEGNMYSTFKSQLTKFHGCRFSPNGQFIAAVGTSKTVYLWKKLDLNSGGFNLDGHCNEVANCDFSPDSALLVTACFDTKIIIWSTHTRQRLRSFGHLHPSPRLIFAGGANDHYVRGVTFNRNGMMFASVCDDGYVRFWNLGEMGDPTAISHESEAISCQFSSDGSALAVGFLNGDVKFLSTPMPVPSLLQLSRQVVCKQTVPGEINRLPLPKMLMNYLQYRDFLQDDSRIG